MAQNKLVIERVDELEPVPNPHEENMGLQWVQFGDLND